MPLKPQKDLRVSLCFMVDTNSYIAHMGILLFVRAVIFYSI